MTLNGQREQAGLPESLPMHFTLSDAPRLVKPKRAADMLGVDRVTIYRLLWAGELAGLHLGRTRLITVASIDALIARRLDEEPKR